MTIPGQEPRPAWWRVRPAEIVERCNSVTRGRAEAIAVTPMHLPVYAVFYGDFNDPAPQTNWSAGSSSGKDNAYFKREGQVPTVVFCAGIHGAEAESVAAAMNLIQALETGSDYRGVRHEKLEALLRNFRLIILPCVNMDGRAISPDHLKNASFRDFRVASQGAWLDGSLVDWLGSKEHFPLPLDRVNYPGGYPNSEGFNIMHDACPGHIRTAEARAVLQLAEHYAVDFFLNGHSCEGEPCLLAPQEFGYPTHIARGKRAFVTVNHALFEQGLRGTDVTAEPAAGRGVNLNTLVTLASGALAMTLECSVTKHATFDGLMEANFVALEALLESALTDPFVQRGILQR